MKTMIQMLSMLMVLSIPAMASNVGDWLEIGPDARSIGMGGAQTSMVNDAYASYWNPAGLRDVQEMDMTFTSLFGQVDYKYIAYVHPFDFGTLGFGYTGVGVSGIQSTSYNVLINEPVNLNNDFSYGANAFTVSYAKDLDKLASQWLQGDWTKKVRVGGTFKILTQSLQDYSSNGFTVDLGFQYAHSDKLKFGGMLFNALPLGFIGSINWSNGTTETLPMKGRAGASYAVMDNLTLAADLDLFGYKVGGVYLGAEYAYQEMLFGRVGYHKNALSLGLGLAYQGAKLDFSYTQAPTDYMDTTTRISMGYVFGSKTKTPIKEVAKPVVPSIEDKGLAPEITVQNPLENWITELDMVNVNGEVKNTSKLFYNLAPTLLSSKKTFDFSAFLDMGKNAILLTASNGKGMISEKVVKILRLMSFSDVTAETLGVNEIKYLATLGKIKGFPQGTFKPKANLTRAEFATLLTRIKGITIDNTKTIAMNFVDVGATHWAAPYVDYALKQGYVSGFPDGTFRANTPITRIQGITVISKLENLSIPNQAQRKIFSDLPVSHWGAATVEAAMQAGLVPWDVNKPFNPNQTLSRAEVCMLIAKTKIGQSLITELLDFNQGYDPKQRPKDVQ